MTIFGDFNIRIGNHDDFIPGIDDVISRNVIDFKTSQYCDTFLDFLISTHFCVLNGRNYKQNDFTSVSTRGCAVVDYCLIPYEQLYRYTNFDVKRSAAIVTDVIGVETMDRISVPDHSILLWSISLEHSLTADTSSGHGTIHQQVKDIQYNRNITEQFMCDEDTFTRLEHTIQFLESNQHEQACLNSAYNDFIDIVQHSMNSDLNPRVKLSDGQNNKRRRLRKPWWTIELGEMWNELCYHEKAWLKCKHTDAARKRMLKDEYVRKRKSFDRVVQRNKRQYWLRKQDELLECCDNNNQSSEFWKKIGKIGIGAERSQTIPMEVKIDGTITNDIDTVLNHWKKSFENILNSDDTTNNMNNNVQHNGNNRHIDNEALNIGISIIDVERAVTSLNKNKAAGYDNIPSEILCSKPSIHFLHKLFCVCFDTGKIPDAWNYSIITPVIKSNNGDKRDPTNYRGVSVTVSIYKAYCKLLNDRLTKWAESNDIIQDEQNGFRRNRSTIDQLSTLTNIIENRKRTKQSTFVAYVDFSKAYDRIDRNLLWSKLCDIGIRGKMFEAIKSIYSNIQCAVKINGYRTKWFSQNIGLKQGCLLSTTLFNLYLNDLSQTLNQSGLGIVMGNVTISHLLYADDLVLLAEREHDLQEMLNILSVWCTTNKMTINVGKSKVMHFRNPSVPRTNYNFTCNNNNIDCVSEYKYLGLVLSDTLDYNITAKCVAQSATRALGLLISKFKAAGGLPYQVYTKLYDSLVWPIISYGAAIWGTKEFACINAVHNRASRFFLGVGKYAPNAGVNGDMGWLPAGIRQWKTVISHWFRLNAMDDDRINYKVFKMSYLKRRRLKNWCKRVDEMVPLLEIDKYYSKREKETIINSCVHTLFSKYKQSWSDTINSDQGSRAGRGNKLRTYKLYKHVYEPEQYVQNHILPRHHRSTFAKFRLGVVPLKIETGRYQGIALNDRICFNCLDDIEDEKHVLLHCGLYQDIRHVLFENCGNIIENFNMLNDSDKFSNLMSNPRIVKYSAKACHDILTLRRNVLYN